LTGLKRKQQEIAFGICFGPGVSSLDSAQAGELTIGGAAAKVPDNIQDMRDSLAKLTSGDIPSVGATPESLTTFGGGGFAIPGAGGGRTSYGGAARAGQGGGFGNPYTNPASSGTGALTGLITDKANEMAKKYNIDATWLSDTMEGIRAGESRHGRDYDKKDDALESSWGPFQLNRRRGLGVQFEKDTGLDVRDASTIPAQAAWVAKYLATGHGTGAWMGFHGRRKANSKWGDS
jgi:hypothetical protein